MHMKNVAKLFAVTVVAAGLGLAAAAQAADVNIIGTGYAGVAGNGNSGTDAFGQTWLWNFTSGDGINSSGLSAWGTPGLGFSGLSGYDGSRPATDFSVAFSTSSTGTYINTTPSPSPHGYDEETRFSVCNSIGLNCVAWTPVYNPTVNPLQVNFYAPAGTSLVDGDQYWVNVVFTTGDLSGATNTGFSAVYSTTNVPEASTWAMMILGIAGVGGAMRGARRKQTEALLDA